QVRCGARSARADGALVLRQPCAALNGSGRTWDVRTKTERIVQGLATPRRVARLRGEAPVSVTCSQVALAHIVAAVEVQTSAMNKLCARTPPARNPADG